MAGRFSLSLNTSSALLLFLSAFCSFFFFFVSAWNMNMNMPDVGAAAADHHTRRLDDLHHHHHHPPPGDHHHHHHHPPHPLTRRFEFHVKYTNVTRLCHTKRIVTVNDQFPGPTLYAREGDRLLVKVSNELPDKNITIHWHGVRQLRTAWFDGPAYITQCPIQPGHTYLYNFTLLGQRGTLFWHAHITWMRATVHGALVILPKLGTPYPFPAPTDEIPLVLGEWWNSDTELVIKQALQSGAGPNVSDAYTVNGHPGALYNCSSEDMFKLHIERNRTYLLRIVNAGLNQELFFGIANHTLTVVEIDASYTKPLSTSIIRIAPGQTTNALLSTTQQAGRYFIAARAYDSAGPTVPFDNSTTIAVLEYNGFFSRAHSSMQEKPVMPTLPPYNDTTIANNFSNSLRSLNSRRYPAKVPQTVDRHLFFTVGLARKPCPHAKKCQGPSGGKFSAAVNNISFSLPNIALLQTYFLRKGLNGIFTTDFPDNPIIPFNFTGTQPKNLTPLTGTRVSHLSFNSSMQLVLQGTNILGAESHPIHLHGFNFFIVGEGTGNYNHTIDPQKFNLVDPPERNTVNVPKGGWVALRFLADNPGVWFMHCHLEVHTSWGLDTAFLVDNGVGPQQTLEPPPLDLPSC